MATVLVCYCICCIVCCCPAAVLQQHKNAVQACFTYHLNLGMLTFLLQVLHLAEVLHNTPKHPLCVKALQRRAAAYQVCCAVLAVVHTGAYYGR